MKNFISVVMILSLTMAMLCTSVYAQDVTLGGEKMPLAQPRSGYIFSEKPLVGKASDYTIDQGTKKRSIVFEKTIASSSASALAITLGLMIPPAAVAIGVGDLLLNAATAFSSSSKTAYVIETTKGYSAIPGLYHKYEQTWYLDSAYTQKAGSSVYYDGWN